MQEKKKGNDSRAVTGMSAGLCLGPAAGSGLKRQRDDGGEDDE